MTPQTAAFAIAGAGLTAVMLYAMYRKAAADAEARFSSAPVGSPATPCSKDKALAGEVVEVEWKSGIKVSVSPPAAPTMPRPPQETVMPPHWAAGLAVQDDAGSLRPGVYLVKGKGSEAVNVKVRITTNRNVSGNGKLTGTFGGMQIEGSCPTAVGEHVVSATIKNLPDAIHWYRPGDASWGLDAPDYGASIALANSSYLEAFVILDTPAAFFDPPGVWAEVLRFLCDRTGVTGLKTPAEVAAKLAGYFHGSHGLKYDTTRGAPRYGASGSGGTFKLASYMDVAWPIVNCYDQASAMQVFCGAVGAKLDWYYLAPFGYINPTNLIGVGMCNNPFYSAYRSQPLVPSDDPARSAFGNHAFCGLAAQVLDACAGPHAGNETKEQYCTASIDARETTRRGSVPGTANDITQPGGITKVV